MVKVSPNKPKPSALITNPVTFMALRDIQASTKHLQYTSRVLLPGA